MIHSTEGSLGLLSRILRKEKKLNKGQSTIEFLFSFFFIIGFIFVFLQMTLNATEGYMVHYATYMASRNFLVAEQNSPTENNATQAFKKSKDTYQSIFKTGISKLAFNEPLTNRPNMFVGVHTEYKRKFSAGIVGAGKIMTLVSESYLGREPTKGECKTRICDAFQMIVGNAVDCKTHVTVFDNGC